MSFYGDTLVLAYGDDEFARSTALEPAIVVAYVADDDGRSRDRRGELTHAVQLPEPLLNVPEDALGRSSVMDLRAGSPAWLRRATDISHNWQATVSESTW